MVQVLRHCCANTCPTCRFFQPLFSSSSGLSAASHLLILCVLHSRICTKEPGIGCQSSARPPLVARRPSDKRRHINNPPRGFLPVRRWTALMGLSLFRQEELSISV